MRSNRSSNTETELCACVRACVCFPLRCSFSFQGKLKPIHYAHNDCGLFSVYSQSPALVASEEGSSGKKGGYRFASVGGLAPNCTDLLLTTTMKCVTLEQILLAPSGKGALKHKVFCCSGDWAIQLDSPQAMDSLQSLEAERRDSLQLLTWEKLQQNIEDNLGEAFVSACEFFIVHATSKIAHGDGLDTQLLGQTTHIVDSEAQFAQTYFGKEDAFGGVLVRPDGRVGAIGPFPDFLRDIALYRDIV